MIEVDLRSIIPSDILHTLSPAVSQAVLIDVAEAARAKWISLANSKLKSSQQEYVRAISPVHHKLNLAWIELVGQFPNMIEEGFASFDMRTTLLAAGARGVKEGKDGSRYRSIMFRQGTGNTTGRNMPKINDAYAAELGSRRAQSIGRAAHKAMKGLGATTSKPGQATQWGERLGAGAGGAQALRKGQKGPAGHALTHGHKSDLFAGAYRFEEQYGKKTQSFYGTFRTISTAVPEGWIHPGYQPGARLAQEVEAYVGRIAPVMFAAAADTAGGT